jgi:hypothetical protein
MCPWEQGIAECATAANHGPLCSAAGTHELLDEPVKRQAKAWPPPTTLTAGDICGVLLIVRMLCWYYSSGCGC